MKKWEVFRRLNLLEKGQEEMTTSPLSFSSRLEHLEKTIDLLLKELDLKRKYIPPVAGKLTLVKEKEEE